MAPGSKGGKGDQGQAQQAAQDAINDSTGISFGVIKAIGGGILALLVIGIGFAWNVALQVNDLRHIMIEYHTECMSNRVFRDWRDKLQQDNPPPFKVPLVDKNGNGE